MKRYGTWYRYRIVLVQYSTTHNIQIEKQRIYFIPISFQFGRNNPARSIQNIFFYPHSEVGDRYTILHSISSTNTMFIYILQQLSLETCQSEPIRVLPPHIQMYVILLRITFQCCHQCCRWVPFLIPLKQRTSIWMKQLQIILENTLTNSALKGVSRVIAWCLRALKTKKMLKRWILHNLLATQLTKTKKQLHYIEYII